MNLTIPQSQRQEPHPAILSGVSTYLEFALDNTLGLVRAHAGSLFLWDDVKKALVLKAARGPYQDRIRNVHVRLREGISGWVGDQGRSLLVTNVREDGRFNRIERAGRYETVSFISLPLISSNKLIGVINITERMDLQPFTEEDHARARLFVQQIAIAYDNMRAVERCRMENHRLQEKIACMEETLELQAPLVSVGKLASSLAHELNNPLDSIRRYVNLALDQVMEDSLARGYVLKAKEGVRRAVQVTRGLLQYARESSRIVRHEADLNQLVRQSVEVAASDGGFKNIEVSLRLCREPAYVLDAGLRVILRNLFKNAHQAMGGCGKLEITSRIEGDQVHLVVKDNGCGMTETVKRQLFEPFFTTKETEGTGIGLTLCRELVHKAGGAIECESSLGRGTAFVLKFPLRRKGM